MLISNNKPFHALYLTRSAALYFIAALFILKALSSLRDPPSVVSPTYKEPYGRWKEVHAALQVPDISPVDIKAPVEDQTRRRRQSFVPRFDLRKRAGALESAGRGNKGGEELWIAKSGLHERAATLEDIRKDYAEVALIQKERARERERREKDVGEKGGRGRLIESSRPSLRMKGRGARG
ncbi:hypothetical protein EW146_g398 [Bondarzewia mesenterica]|uniref:Uncharacterized protein n=1 Tax=Bondarzewia mesenterica TaxID=1095465 RepID=A0A4V3XGE7_9AGAM|nr:hypothetical protein EW146_g398 [Bondarzewia mesenterica]